MKIKLILFLIFYLFNKSALQAMHFTKGTTLAHRPNFGHFLPKSSSTLFGYNFFTGTVLLNKGKSYCCQTTKSKNVLWKRWLPFCVLTGVAVGSMKFKKSLPIYRKENQEVQKKYATIALRDIHCNREHADLIKKLKELTPQSPRHNFEEILEELNIKNITVCELIKKICEDKKSRALRALIKEGSLDPRVIIKIESLNHGTLIPLTIHISSSLQVFTQEIQNTIEAIFPTNKFVLNYIFSTTTALHSSMEAEADLLFNRNDKETLIIINEIDYTLVIGAKDIEAHKDKLLGILRHEKQHLFDLDASTEDALRILLIDKAGKIELLKTQNYKSVEIVDNNFYKFMRAQEVMADRIPAACECIQVADTMCKAIEFLYKKGPKKYHPTSESRLEWVEKIRRLRQIEQENLLKTQLYGLV